MDNYYEKLASFNKCIADESFKDFSDGHHTFGELYHHRAILSAALFNEHKDIAWKSLQHSDPVNNPMFEDMFICGINTPEGQATYHYNKDEYWDLFDIPILECAPEFDGHTPDEAIQRIENMVRNGIHKDK